MNLHGIVSAAIGTVNPHVKGTVKLSAGYGKARDFSQVPLYTTISNVTIQSQPLTGRVLEHVDALNIQGTLRSFHLSGVGQARMRQLVEAVSRSKGKGGDLIDLDGQRWLIVQVLEAWPDWCRVVGQLQDDGVSDGKC
jgi:hypothetical protein